APGASAFYAEHFGSEGLSLARSASGRKNTFVSLTSGVPDKGSWVVPFQLDPSDPNVVWTAGHAVWRSDDGGFTWRQVSSPLQVGQGVTALAVAPSDPNMVLVATDTGLVYRPTVGEAASPSWTTVTGPMQTGFPDGFVSSIAIDPDNPRVAFATHLFGGG